jgi:hypothetical protein
MKQRALDKLKHALGPVWTTRLRCLVRGLGFPRWGNLRRLKAFSDEFGWDRGTPIDRYYVDRFFERHRADITGDVLEVGTSMYTRRYGHDLRTIDAFDIDPQFEDTIRCDLAHSENILKSEAYDCVLLPCTLSVLREIDPCLRNALRVVRPGGVILANAAGLGRLDRADIDFWRPTPAGWRELLQRTWSGCEVVVEGEGNLLALEAFNLGLSLEELKPKELDHNDPIFPLVTNILCRKPKR